MEPNDIRLKVHLTPSWRKGNKEAYIYLPNDDILNIKCKLLSAIDDLDNNPNNYEFIVKDLENGVSLAQEDDLYLMLANTNPENENLVRIFVNKVEKKESNEKKDKSDEVRDDIRINGVYKGSEEVSCAFCRASNRKKQTTRDLGPFYGPFNYKNQSFYVHELCALWTPDVYLDEKTNKLMNLEKEVRRCNKIRCSYCGGFGGGIGCLYKDCKKTYHFKCLLEEDINCHLNEDNYTILCPQHTDIEKMSVEEMCCELCGKDTEEDKLLICEKCLKGFHMFCLTPALNEVPENEWFCGACAGTEEQVLWDNDNYD